MPTTANDLIQQTRQYLFSGQPEELNQLLGSLTNSATSFALTYDLGGIAKGSIIEIDLEQIYVFDTDAPTKTITNCIRGYNGTTAATHAASATVTIGPKFPNARILQAINDDLKDLSSPMNGLYQVKTVTLTYDAARYGYDLTSSTDVIGIIDIRYRGPGPDKTWPRIENYALLRGMPTTGTYGDFPSSNALVMYDGAFPGLPIRVRYKAPFVSFSALTDDATTVAGLTSNMYDIPPLGAAIRLTAGREIKRNFDEAQGEPRRAEEVPPQAAMQSTRELARLRQERIRSEQARLISSNHFELVS